MSHYCEPSVQVLMPGLSTRICPKRGREFYGYLGYYVSVVVSILILFAVVPISLASEERKSQLINVLSNCSFQVRIITVIPILTKGYITKNCVLGRYQHVYSLINFHLITWS
jgi:hypothetical protein